MNTTDESALARLHASRSRLSAALTEAPGPRGLLIRQVVRATGAAWGPLRLLAARYPAARATRLALTGGVGAGLGLGLAPRKVAARWGRQRPGTLAPDSRAAAVWWAPAAWLALLALTRWAQRPAAPPGPR